MIYLSRFGLFVFLAFYFLGDISGMIEDRFIKSG
jgi:hypothetical protein